MWFHSHLAVAATVSSLCAPFVAHADPDSHCRDDERVVFSCSTKKQVISVCASTNLSQTSGYLQYRYGRVGAPEISIPPIDRPPRFQTDAYAYINPIGDGNGYIRFKNGRYAYIVYAFSYRGATPDDGSAPGWNNFHGVLVEKDNKVVSNLKCKPYDGVHSDIEPGFVQGKAKFAPSSTADAMLDNVMSIVMP